MGVKRKAEVMKPTAHPQEKPGGQLDTRMSRPENFLVFQARKITLGAFSISVGKDLGADESPPPLGGEGCRRRSRQTLRKGGDGQSLEEVKACPKRGVEARPDNKGDSVCGEGGQGQGREHR